MYPSRIISQFLAKFPLLFLSAASLAVVGLFSCPVIAYGQAGIPIWTNRYNGPGNGNDDGTAITVDGSGNVYVTGVTGWLYGNGNYATIKYSSAGSSLWTNYYDGSGNDEDSASSIAIESNDDVYVTGSSTGSNSSYDYATIAYSGAGLPLWTNRYSGPMNNYDFASSLAVNGSGNVYVTGVSFNNSSNVNNYADYATIAYSNVGTPLWTNRYDGPGDGGDGGTSIAVDKNDNVYVTGWSDGTNGSVNYSSWTPPLPWLPSAWQAPKGHFDYATVAYSATGMPLWTNYYNGPGNADDEASALAVGKADQVYVTGSSTGSNSFYDYATIAYSSAGLPLWTNRYDDPVAGDDYATAIAVGPNGNVYVTGYSEGTNDYYDYLTIAYSSSGVPLWTNRYRPWSGEFWYTDTADAYPSALAVDTNGNVFVTGYVGYVQSIATGYATVGYSSTGIPLWTNRYDYSGPGNSQDSAKGIAIDGNGNVYVTGTSWDSYGSDYDDYVTIKYAGSSANPVLSPIPLNIHLISSQIVLNWTNAAFSLQSAPKVEGVYTNVPGAVSPYTNDTSKPQRFFRLIEN